MLYLTCLKDNDCWNIVSSIIELSHICQGESYGDLDNVANLQAIEACRRAQRELISYHTLQSVNQLKNQDLAKLLKEANKSGNSNGLILALVAPKLITLSYYDLLQVIKEVPFLLDPDSNNYEWIFSAWKPEYGPKMKEEYSSWQESFELKSAKDKIESWRPIQEFALFQLLELANGILENIVDSYQYGQFIGNQESYESELIFRLFGSPKKAIAVMIELIITAEKLIKSGKIDQARALRARLRSFKYLIDLTWKDDQGRESIENSSLLHPDD